jgi:hypothetical protein
VDAHTFTKQAEKVSTNVCQKADGNCFLGQERRADGGIHEIGDYNISSVLKSTKKSCMGPAIRNKRHGMLTYGVVFLHDNMCPHTAARTRALLEHFNWELFEHPPCSPDLALHDYHLFTYLKYWFGSQRFNNNEELMEDVKTWLSSQVADLFDTGIKNLFPDTTGAQFRR